MGAQCPCNVMEVTNLNFGEDDYSSTDSMLSNEGNNKETEIDHDTIAPLPTKTISLNTTHLKAKHYSMHNAQNSNFSISSYEEPMPTPSALETIRKSDKTYTPP
eukprot:411046_1